MDKITVTGLVLRETAKGDNDKILTILTPEHGKLTVTGKGVRSLKNKNMVTTQQFCCASYTLSRNKAGYYYISDSDLTESFYGLRGNLEQLALASYVCDVIEHVSVEENDETEILRLTLNTLYAIANETKPVCQIKGAFELKCAVESGFSPDLSACAICGGTESELYYLDILNGDILCSECMAKNSSHGITHDINENGEWSRPFITMSPRLLNVMRYISEARLQRMLAFALDDEIKTEFSSACERYLLHHLGRSFKTLEFYKNIIKTG